MVTVRLLVHFPLSLIVTGHIFEEEGGIVRNICNSMKSPSRNAFK